MLSVESLSKSFGDTQVLKNISLDIPDGETTVILGPSGSGKSTLLRCLNLLETPQSGTLTIDDAQVDYSQKLTDAQVRDIRSRSAMVFQQFNLFPNYTALKNVALAPTLNGTLSAQQAQERARELLAKVGLADKVDSYPDALSGGQQQRVALARAMVVRPKVLLFDEPLSNLDAKLRVKMRVEIRRMQKRLGISSVYVTHDQSEAMAMSDRIVVMNSGRIEQVDTPEEIYLHPASVFVADFVGRANFVPAQAQEVGEDGMVEIEALGQKIRVHSSEGAKEAVREGKETVVLVRPESMRIQPTDEKPATLTGSLGQVVTSIFYGETVEYEIETEFGSLVCVVSDPRAEDLLEEGQYVRLGIEAEKAWLLPSGQLASA